MSKYVTVTLTELEASAAIVACLNMTMDIGDTPGDQYLRAAIRAEVKLRAARGETGGLVKLYREYGNQVTGIIGKDRENNHDDTERLQTDC